MEQRQTQFANRLAAFAPAQWELIPDFGLYMDQVITFIERQCKNLYMDGERVFTPAMVNNYVKFGLVDRPVDKKYGREQLAQLMMICVLKQSASLEGMKTLLTPSPGSSMQEHYQRFCDTEREVFDTLLAAIPFPSPMTCAVQGAAYLFLCNALLAKLPEPKSDAKPEAGKPPKNGEPDVPQPGAGKPKHQPEEGAL